MPHFTFVMQKIIGMVTPSIVKSPAAGAGFPPSNFAGLSSGMLLIATSTAVLSWSALRARK